LLGASIVAAVYFTGEPGMDGTADRGDPDGPEVRGVTLDARARPSDEELNRLANLGATHLFVIPFGWQQSADHPGVTLRTRNDRWYSEDDEGIRDLDRRADSLGMAVVVKPHIWVRGDLPSGIDFGSKDDWVSWESDYRDLAMHYARLSAEINAPLFVIGTELAGPAVDRPAFWRQLVADIRSVYSGRLTYAANWWEEYEHVSFWDALDYVGVQAYFPLETVSTDSTRAEPTDFHRSWETHLTQLEQLSSRLGRPILFTEIGYRSIGYAAVEPWRWPERSESARPRPDLQADLYTAFFDQVWHHDWFSGAVVWKWRPGPVPDGRMSRDALDFTIRDKPAERIIADWYARP